MASDRYTLLVLDGELPPVSMIDAIAKSAERVICTDGVAAALAFLEPQVSAIIGDMDSLEDLEHYVSKGIEIISDPDQYSNDFEKALHHLIEKTVDHVLILGLSGKRLDHTLTNVSVMKRFTKQFRSLVAIDLYGVSYIVFGPIERHKIEAREKTLVSLTPSPEAIGVTTENLYYPIAGGTMRLGDHEGLSNIVTSEDGAYLSLEDGAILVSIVTNP